MEIYKVHTVWLKALNMHNIVTHNVHRDEKWYQQFNKKLTHNADINKAKGLSITM